jgi:hypothetical protein
MLAPSKDLDHLIREKEKELRPIHACMEELRLHFISDTVEFAAKWCEETAQQYVTKYPEITLTLNKEKLSTMKAKVNNLMKNADKIVKDALSLPRIWWHMEPHKNESFSLFEQLGNEQVGNRFLRQLTNP